MLRTRCLNHACPFTFKQDGNSYIYTLALNATGTIQWDTNNPPNGVSADLSEGPTKIGVVQLGDIAASTSFANRRWTNFRWMNIVYGKVALQPALPAAKPDSTINFSVRSGALAPIIVKYTWEFGDGTAQSTTTTSAAAHAFTVGGDYKVVVKLFDASNRLIGKDSTTASISAQSVAYSVWALNTTTFATVNPPMNLDTTQNVVQVLTRKYNALISLWGTPRSAAVTPTLWVVKTPGSFNNRLGQQAVGVYFSDSLPGSNRGLDPYPEPLALAGDVSEFGVDTPEFLPKWNVTGAPPDDGRIVALGALRGTTDFACIGSFTAATFIQAVDFTMKGNTGSGTVTYTFRVVKTGCNKPLLELTRWQWVVSFTATRIR